MLQKTLNFLQKCGTFYVATTDGNQPRVRPFGLVIEHENKLWFGTANTKEVYRQLMANPRIEISATSPTMEWVRLSGQAVFESNAEVKRKAFELLPMLANIYQGSEDPVFEVFYLAEAEAVFQGMGNYGAPPEVGRF